MSTSSVADLTVDLAAIAHNWQCFKSRLTGTSDCGAVIKANAYGLGVVPILRRLLQEGCKTFFVTNLSEALEVKNAMVDIASELALNVGQYTVTVLSGCAAGEELAFLENRIQPVLVSEEMFYRWHDTLSSAGIRPGAAPAALKLDTGMSRMGLEPVQFDKLLLHPEKLHVAGVNMLMSHLACADIPDDDFNTRQLTCFNDGLTRIRKHIPGIRGSLANSAGVLLGDEYHFSTVRPGIGLYGGNPQPASANPFKPVAYLSLPVVQVRELPGGGYVGYGATCRFESAARLAIVAGGYADGLLRSLSNCGECWIDDSLGSGWRVPVCGRISMDSFVIDITAIPKRVVQVGTRVECLGAHVTIDDVAERAGTISYEILTSLGPRYRRAHCDITL